MVYSNSFSSAEENDGFKIGVSIFRAANIWMFDERCLKTGKQLDLAHSAHLVSIETFVGSGVHEAHMFRV